MSGGDGMIIISAVEQILLKMCRCDSCGKINDPCFINQECKEFMCKSMCSKGYLVCNDCFNEGDYYPDVCRKCQYKNGEGISECIWCLKKIDEGFHCDDCLQYQ